MKSGMHLTCVFCIASGRETDMSLKEGPKRDEEEQRKREAGKGNGESQDCAPTSARIFFGWGLQPPQNSQRGRTTSAPEDFEHFRLSNQRAAPFSCPPDSDPSPQYPASFQKFRCHFRLSTFDC